MRGGIVTNCPEHTSLVSSLHGRRKNLYGSRHCVLYVSLSSHKERLPVVCRDTHVWHHLDQTLLLHQKGHASVIRGIHTHTHTHSPLSPPPFPPLLHATVLLSFQSTSKVKIPISLSLNLCNVKVNHIALSCDFM